MLAVMLKAQVDCTYRRLVQTTATTTVQSTVNYSTTLCHHTMILLPRHTAAPLPATPSHHRPRPVVDPATTPRHPRRTTFRACMKPIRTGCWSSSNLITRPCRTPIIKPLSIRISRAL